MEIKSSWIERFYTTFIYRDICHIFSGALFITIIIYALYGQILLPKGLSLELFGFLMTANFLGISFGMIIGPGKFYSIDLSPPSGYSCRLLLKQDMFNYYDDRVINDLERTRFIYYAGKTVGLSSFCSALILIFTAFYHFIKDVSYPTNEYQICTFLLLAYGIFMYYKSRSSTRKFEFQEKCLIKDIEFKKQIKSDNK